jgi:hypothetical protein
MRKRSIHKTKRRIHKTKRYKTKQVDAPLVHTYTEQYKWRKECLNDCVIESARTSLEVYSLSVEITVWSVKPQEKLSLIERRKSYTYSLLPYTYSLLLRFFKGSCVVNLRWEEIKKKRKKTKKMVREGALPTDWLTDWRTDGLTDWRRS